ncbi:MAG: response regulator [Kofleriaceae bacterium]|nr:response regulator [Kofleriaceae bacterium]
MLILHVEDDDDLAQLLELSFQAFGFKGELRRAPTLREAIALIDDAEELSLVVTDMGLPDGTGLDVIGHVRKHSVWHKTPILVVTGDSSPDKLGLSYSLGANSYVLKASRHRPLSEVVKSLYEHWVLDVVPPPQEPRVSRPSEALSRLVRMRHRHCAIYLRFAVQLPPSAEFWLARALNQSNRANLLDFLSKTLERAPREVPEDMMTAMERSLWAHERDLGIIERRLAAQPVTSLDEACEVTLRLIALGDHPLQLRAASLLFPVSEVAARALLDAWATNLEVVVDWMSVNVTSSNLRAQLSSLRDQAAVLRQAALQRPPIDAHDVSARQ